MDLREEVNAMRYEWGTCAVCGEDAPPVRESFLGYSSKYDRDTPSSLTQPRMLCPQHQNQYKRAAVRSLKSWVESHRDAHLFFHVLDVRCPDCIYCTGCDESMPMKGDYFCYECRYPDG